MEQLLHALGVNSAEGQFWVFNKTFPVGRPVAPFSPERKNYTHISLGASLPNSERIGYSLASACQTKTLLMIDIDDKNIEELLSFLSSRQLHPTYINETSNGYHLLYLSPSWIFLRYPETGAINSPVFENYYNYTKLFLPKLKRKLQSLFPTLKIDKLTTEHYTRIPVGKSEFTGRFYNFEDLYERLKSVFEISAPSLKELGQEEYTEKNFIPLFDPYDILSVCKLAEHLNSLTAYHNYDQWIAWAWIYVNAYLGEEDEQRKRAIEEAFHKWASLYPDYKKEQNESLFNNLANKGFFRFSCEWFRNKTGLHNACLDCPLYQNYKGQGLRGASPYDLLEPEEQEIIILPDNPTVKYFVYTKNHTIYYIRAFINPDTGAIDYDQFQSSLTAPKEIPLGPSFKIEYALKYKDGVNKVKRYLTFSTTSKLTGETRYITIDFPDEVKKFPSLYVKETSLEKELNKEESKLLIELLYRKHRKFTAANNILYTRAPDLSKEFELPERGIDFIDRGFLPYPKTLYELAITHFQILPKFLFHVEGNSKEYFERLRPLLEKDKTLKYLFGASLLMLLHAPTAPNSIRRFFIRELKEGVGLNENPMIILYGSSGTGKTTRIEIVLSLWGQAFGDAGVNRSYPAGGSTEMSPAYRSKILSKAWLPIGLDDYGKRRDQKDDTFGELLKEFSNTATASGRMVAHQDYIYIPFKSVVFISMEITHFRKLRIDFEDETGIIRRALFLGYSEPPDSGLFDELIAFREFSRTNYGHIKEVIDYLKNNFDKAGYEQKLKHFKGKSGVENAIYRRLAQVVVFTYNFLKFLNINTSFEELWREAYEFFIENNPYTFNTDRVESTFTKFKVNFDRTFRILSENKLTEYSYKELAKYLPYPEEAPMKILAGVLGQIKVKKSIKSRAHVNIKFQGQSTLYKFYTETKIKELDDNFMEQVVKIFVNNFNHLVETRLVNQLDLNNPKEAYKYLFGVVLSLIETDEAKKQIFLDALAKHGEKLGIALEVIQELKEEFGYSEEEVRKIRGFKTIYGNGMQEQKVSINDLPDELIDNF